MEEIEREKLLDELRAKHGPVDGFEFDDGDLVVLAKPPNAHLEYKRFVDAVADGKTSKGEAQEQLVLTCIVYPTDKAQARQLVQRWPSSVGEMANACQELLAGGVKRLGKAQKKQNATT